MNPTPSPTPTVVTSNAGGSAALAFLLLLAVVAGLSLATLVLRGRNARQLSVFQALLASMALLTVLAATVWLVVLAVLGFPSLPRPTDLTVGQVGSIAQLGVGSAAAVGVAVALLVAYRKQRDTESLREARLFAEATAQLGDSNYFVRHSGVLALRDLADSWDSWRQRCIDMLSVALLQLDEQDVQLRSEIFAILRSRFGPSGAWSGSTLTIANGQLAELDLSGLVFSGGTFRVEDLVLSGATNLSGLRLEEGARLIAVNLQAQDRFLLERLHVAKNCGALVQQLTIRSAVQFSADCLSVESGGEVDFDGVTMESKSGLSMRGLRAHGRISLRGVRGHDATVQAKVTCDGGRMRFEDLSLVGGSFSL